MVSTFNRKIQTHEGKRMSFNTTTNGTPLNSITFGGGYITAQREDLKSKRKTEFVDDSVNISKISQGSARIDFVHK